MKLIPVTYVIFDGEYYKIGKAQSILKRMSTIKGGNPRDFHLVYVYTTHHAERFLHRQLRDYHYSGEWFKVDRQTIDKAHSLIDPMLDSGIRDMPITFRHRLFSIEHGGDRVAKSAYIENLGMALSAYGIV